MQNPPSTERPVDADVHVRRGRRVRAVARSRSSATAMLGVGVLSIFARTARGDPPSRATGAPRQVAASRDLPQRAENPLTPAPSIALIDLHAPLATNNGAVLGDWTNRLIVQGMVPIPRLGALPAQLVRAQLPINSLPPTGLNDQRVTGLGDLQLFDLFLLPFGRRAVGIGPMAVMPTSTAQRLGVGGWQLGGAVAYTDMSVPRTLFGALAQLSTTVSAVGQQPATVLQVQPVLAIRITDLLYARSSANWVFNLRTGNFSLPLGLGLGMVVPVRPLVFNMFIEPEVSLFSNGPSSPVIMKFGLVVLYMRGNEAGARRAPPRR